MSADLVMAVVPAAPALRARPLFAGALFLVLLATVPLAVGGYVTGLLSLAAIYGLAAMALGLAVGFGGMISFGHAAYVGAGAYVVLVLQQAGLNEAALVWPAAMLVAGALAWGFGTIALRAQGPAFIMITLALAQMVYLIVGSIQPLGAIDGLALGRRNTLAGWSLGSPLVFHGVVMAAVLLCLYLLNRITRSAFGQALSATRINESRAVALGYDSRRIRLLAFVISGAMCGLAGALFANAYLFVSPSQLHWLLSGELLVMVALGGLGTLVGPLVGGVVLAMARFGLATLTVNWEVILGPLIVLLAIFMRRGLYVWARDCLAPQRP